MVEISHTLSSEFKVLKLVIANWNMSSSAYGEMYVKSCLYHPLDVVLFIPVN
jgi:hypothetical protein